MGGLAFTKKKKKSFEPQRKQKNKSLRGCRTRRFFTCAIRRRFSVCTLYSLESGFLTSSSIEAGRRAIRRFLRRKVRIGIRVFASKSFTKKPSEVRMGGGKGKPQGFLRSVWPGSALFQLRGVSLTASKFILTVASKKFGVKTAVIGSKARRFSPKKLIFLILKF
jgi:large subunit ribosomal protein L16